MNWSTPAEQPAKTCWDIHTHQLVQQEGHRTIVNVREDFGSLEEHRLCSLGLHPWYLDIPDLENTFQQLSVAAGSSQVLAIGECGLDKVCRTDMALQVYWFRRQIGLAQAFRKPLVIHCVRAFDEVLSILREESPEVPVIFHGFQKSLALAERICKAGYYLSFGEALGRTEVAAVFRQVPMDRVFLETDTSTLSIMEIYRMAAEARGISLDEMRVLVCENVERVFHLKVE